MPLTFPSSPAVNQTSTQNGRVYRWSGLAWEFDSFTTAADDARWNLFLPPAPTSVTATAGNGQASVTWTAPSVLSVTPVTDYVVQYSSNSGSTWTTFSDGTATSTSAVVTGLQNSTSYVFRVAGTNGVGTGAYSAASSAVTPIAGDPLFGNVSLLLHMDGSNGSTSFTDSGPAARTVTVASGASISTSQNKFGGASGYFNGSGYATVATGNHFNFAAGDFAVEFWYRPESNGGDCVIGFGWEGGSTSPFLAYRYGNSTQTRFYATSNGGSWDIASDVPWLEGGTFGQWYWMVAARSGGSIRLYRDGSLISTITTSAALRDSPGPLHIGARANGSSPTAGYYDELRITKGSDRGYTGSTITVPTAPFPEGIPGTDPFFSSVALLLHMGGSNGSTTFTDSSGTPKTVTATGGAQISTAQSKFGGSSLFVNGGYLTTPRSAFEFGTADFVIEMWLYSTATGGFKTALSNYTSFTSGNLLLARSAGGAFTGKWYAINNGVYPPDLASSTNATDNAWEYVALVRNGGTLTLYVNGVAEATKNVSGVSLSGNGSNLWIGTAGDSPSDTQFSGYIDELRITMNSNRGYTGSTITVPTAAFPDA